MIPYESCAIKFVLVVIQWGLKFRTFEYRTHLKSERFYVLIWNGSVLEWSGLQSIAMEPTIRKPNFSKWPLQPRSFYLNTLFVFMIKITEAKAAILKSCDLEWLGLSGTNHSKSEHFKMAALVQVVLYIKTNNVFI